MWVALTVVAVVVIVVVVFCVASMRDDASIKKEHGKGPWTRRK